MRSLLASLIIFGCGSYEGPRLDLGGGSGGVDPGGAQDIGAARAIIESGGVPAPGLITVEGLLSEHDLPTSGAPCYSPICVRPATGIAPSLETGHLERWVHIGMTTGIDLSTWQRPPIDLVIAIDESSSMSGDIAQTTDAAARVVGHMRADDRIAVLSFDDSVHVIKELGAVTNIAGLQTSVRGISAEGGWDINAALDAGYSRLQTATPGRIRRLMIMSCGYPPLSQDLDDPISAKIRTNGASGIGVTFIGILLGWDPKLAELLGKSNGANYYYLNSFDNVQTIFDRDADLMLTPVAYDLALALQLSTGWTLERMYGIPGNADGTPADGYDIATAFFSRRRGGVVARLAWTGNGAAPPAAASVSLSYRPEPALGWTDPENQTIDAMTGAPEPDGTYYGTSGVHKAVMLVNMAVQMIEGCTQWAANDADGARATIRQLHDYLVAEQIVLADPEIDPEIALVAKLLQNMGG